MFKTVLSSLVLMLFIFCGPATAQDHRERINTLIKERKYATAVEYILNNDLLDQPEMVVTYTHLLTDKYLSAINFKLFALKDLEKNETVADLRGKAGKFEMIGGDLEETLFNRLKLQPENPYLNLAVGTYLSRGFQCRCLQPEYFPNQPEIEFRYFDKAYQKGVSDYWSLFRMALRYHTRGDMEKAFRFYKKSFDKNPDHTAGAYNLAIIHLHKNDLKNALFYSDKALGGYHDAKMDADTYHLNGVIHLEMGSLDEAEKSLDRAFDLNKYHAGVFISSLDLYRKKEKQKQYVKAVTRYLAYDYSNTYCFNRYIEFLNDYALHAFDKAVYNKLSNISLKDKNQTGPFNFNMGKLASIHDEPETALKYYHASLSAFKTMEKPPVGAMKALEKLISDLKNAR